MRMLIATLATALAMAHFGQSQPVKQWQGRTANHISCHVSIGHGDLSAKECMRWQP